MSSPQLFTLKGVCRNIRKKVETGTGFHHVDDGFELADIELAIDLEQIARDLGRKAMKGKRGRSQALHGAVVVRVSNRKRVPA